MNGIININEIVNNFLLAADKFMREIVLIVLSDDLLKTNKSFINLKKQNVKYTETQNIFTKMN